MSVFVVVSLSGYLARDQRAVALYTALRRLLRLLIKLQHKKGAIVGAQGEGETNTARLVFVFTT